MTDLTKLTYQELRKGYESQAFMPSDVIKAHVAQMDACRDLNAFLVETTDQAIAEAKIADDHVKQGTMRPLEGLPLAIKDLYCTKDVMTTAASHILKDFVPFYDSTVVARLKEAGVIALGKTNLDEFAMGSSNETSYFGPCLSPYRSPERPQMELTPGGSSGGSSAAVAAHMATASLGTDTGGSIRQPASFCGLVGLKPTYGRCSRFGIIAFASSFDQAGPMTRCVADAADIFAGMSGYDTQDATTAMLPPFALEGKLSDDIKGLRVGIPKEYRDEGLDPEIQAYWDKSVKWLEAAGATVQEVSLPHTHYGLPTYYIIAPAEASTNLARYDGVRYGLREGSGSIDDIYVASRTSGFGDEVKRRIVVGTYVLSAGAYEDYYLRGMQVRRLVREEFKSVFNDVDVLLTPTTPTTAFGLGEKLANPTAMYLSDIYTVGANLAGLPAISIPVGLSEDQLPIGMQLVGFDFQEELLFRVADKIEKAADYIAPSIKGRD